MSAATFLMRLSQGTFNRMRSAEAARAVTDEPAGKLTDFHGHRYCLVITYRRSGVAVPTPVWFGLDRDRLIFRSLVDNGKTKRIRANGRVRLAPCDQRGKPNGPSLEGTARILAPDEEAAAEEVIASNYGLGRRVYNRLAAHRVPGVYIEVRPV